jgi:hypothetical protein
MKKSIYLVFLFSLIFLVGCAAPQSAPAAASPTEKPAQALSPSETPIPSATVTSSPSALPTSTPTATILPSLTPTPTSTTEPTQTPTATPAGFQPGIYGVGGCERITLSGFWWVDLCLINAEIKRDQTMVFNVTWLPYIPGRGPRVTKYSDKNNPNMYITDNLGNHYSFIELGGDAAQDVRLIHERIMHGSYTFPPALPGAHTFTFHDSDNGVEIQDLRFDKPMIAIYEFEFEQSGLALEYRDDLWALTQDENGKPVLNYLPQENCQIQEIESSQPTGKLKNTLAIGPWTFEIYGRLEEKWGIREYLIVAGPPEFDLQNSPMFLVRVPLENSLQCLNDLSTLLGNLRPANGE